MSIRSISFPFLLLNCFAFIFLFGFYGDIILEPNNYMFTQNGDGLKNYFTYASHIKHSRSSINFDGMNFPYGEHFLYTDCHPALTYLLRNLAKLFPAIPDYSIGILNTLILLSFLFTFWVLYFLLQELKISKWFALIFSLGIFLMAPQIERIGGHLALSYCMAIPLSWLLLLKQQKAEGWMSTIVLFINALFWLFIHAYLGMIALSFLIVMVMLQLCIHQEKKITTRSVHALIATVLPIILFYLFAKQTDHHLMRTDNPSGYLLYYAELDNIIIPSYGPLSILWKQIIPFIKLKGEGNAYIGLVNVVLLVYLFFLSLSSIFSAKKRRRLKQYFQHQSLNLSLMASLLILLIAMGLPFVQFPDLLNTFPIFKQFRAIGRFSWPFYFVFTVFGAYLLQGLILSYLKSKYKPIGIGLIFLVLLLPIIETFERQQNIAEHANGKQNLFKKELLSDDLKRLINKIDTNKYQAIFSLPFYHHGSEVFDRPRKDLSLRNTIVMSYHTGIPSIGANLTRSSILESKKIIQMVMPNYYPKPIKNELDTNRSFLLVHSNMELTAYEKDILNRAKPISPMSNGFALYELKYSDLFKDQRTEVINQFESQVDQLSKQGLFYTSDSTSFLYFNDFEEHTSDIVFQGKGTFVTEQKRKNTIIKFPSNTFDSEKKYAFKLWMYNGEQNTLNQYVKIMVDAYNTNHNQWENLFTGMIGSAEVINNNWSLVEGEFKVNHSSDEIVLQTKASKFSNTRLYVDNLIITEKGLNVFKKETDHLFYNNHIISLPL